MYKLSRVHPPDKEVLEDISLSFLPGRQDRRDRAERRRQVDPAPDHGRRATPSSAATRSSRPARPSGLLEQEPQLDAEQGRARERRGRASRGLRDLLDRFNELAANYSEETADEFARLQERIDAADAWNLDTTLEIAMDALRLRPATPT